MVDIAKYNIKQKEREQVNKNINQRTELGKLREI